MILCRVLTGALITLSHFWSLENVCWLANETSSLYKHAKVRNVYHRCLCFILYQNTVILEQITKWSRQPKKCLVEFAFHYLYYKGNCRFSFFFFFHFLAFFYSCSHLEGWGGVQPKFWRLYPAEFSSGAVFSQSC